MGVIPKKVKELIFKRIQFDNDALGVLLLILISQLFFANGGYLFFGSIVLWVLFTNLQQPYKPSIFTIILLYHVLQIMAGVWLSNFVGKDINFRSDNLGNATIYAFIGLIFLFGPVIYYQNKIPSLSLGTLRKYAEKLSTEKSFQAYVVAFFTMNTLGGVAFVVPGLAQVIFSFMNIKWFLFLLFGFQVILKKQMVKIFLICTFLEFGIGFFSYFSNFKTVFFFIGFLAIFFIAKVTMKQLLILSVSVLALFFLGVGWTSIKGEYREFLNEGSKSQSVSVERGAAIDKLIELSERRDEDDFDNAAVNFLDRVQYTYHLAKTMDRVPSVLPHENGANIASILEFVTTPRFLNPDKPRLESSVKATKYTGIAYLGYSSGVSFSLGYFADCYIDFGYYGMMVPLFLLGVIFGSTYFYFVRHSSDNIIFNFSVVGAMFMEFTAFEADGTYLMGRLFATLVTFMAVKLFLFPWLIKYLQTADQQKESKVPMPF